MKCLLCESENVEVVFHLANAPRLSQKVLTAEDIKSQGSGRIDLDLYRCKDCGMVQVDPATLTQPDDYWDDYLNSRAVTDLYVQYDKMLADTLAFRHHAKGRTCFEVGCGDGYFSAELMKRGLNVTAIEPSEKACKVARAAGVKVYHGYLDDNIDKVVHEKFDAFVCKQVMDLLKDHNALLRNLGRVLNPGAIGVIDVPSWSKTLLDKRYYSVLPDRIGYYTAATLTKILERNNFHVLEIFHGAEDEYVGAYAIYEGEADGLMRSFKNEFTAFNTEFRNLIDQYRKAGKTLAGWGAGAKGVTVFAFTGTGPETVQYVVDRDFNRWNHYMPVSLIPILEPDTLNKRPVDGVIITAAMFYKEITRDLISKYNFKGDIIILAPLPHVLTKGEIDAIMNG